MLTTALLIGLPAAASGATKPTVTTGGATKITSTTARIVGTIIPNGAKTTYRFHYGTSTLYGTSTPIKVAGSGTTKVTVRADITGLAPNTRYHYRLVARNSKGTTNGADRNFKTKVQPLALSLVASPNPVLFGNGTILSGALTGTGNAGKQIVLQRNPWPFTQGFTPVGNPLVANQQGVFAFTLLSVPLNTQYRVYLPSKPSVVSTIVGVGVAPRVSTHLNRTKVRTGSRVRFSGTIRPARTGMRIVIQRLRNGRWLFAASTKARKGGQTFSRYAKRVKIRRGGRYRVLLESADGGYVATTGRRVMIRRRF
ncbi:MAG: hypothetical protein ACRDLS_06945 [Solirubrobacteraceae bacterium]